MITEIIKILSWPIVVIILSVVFVKTFRKEIGELFKGLRLKEVIVLEKLKIIFSKQFKVTKEDKSNKNSFFENLYGKMTGAQLRFLLLLREWTKSGKGMNCGFVSNYFQNIIKSKTDMYYGWITPFITAYLVENNLVSVKNNFYRLEKTGEEFLNYIESKKYPIQTKKL